MRALFTALVIVISGPIVADNTAHQNETNACAEVAVDGIASPSYSCLTQKLRPAATPQKTAAELTGGDVARRPGNQVGLFNQAATSHRMGNTFGTSVLPQRPNTTPPASPLMASP